MPILSSKILPLRIFSAGAVRATVPRTFNCGTEMPIDRQNNDVHAPAAQSTTEVLIGPCSVTTEETVPAVDSMPRTAQDVSIVAPARTAALAMAGVVLCGSARPSLAVYMAPCQLGVAPSTRPESTVASTTRVSSSYSFAVSIQSWKPCMSFSVLAVNRQPPFSNPTLSPISFSSSLKIRMLSIIIGNSRGSRPCWRTQPQFRPDCSPAI